MLLKLKRLKHLINKDGKLVKYGFYAIGEIFLVVVGILIALEVDNWDKENSNKKQEQQYYQRMKAELLEDKRLLQNEIQYNQSFIEKFSQARSIIIAQDQERNQELAVYATDLRSISDFRRSSSIYQALVNSGEIKLVKNTEVMSLFQKLERDYAYIERLENVHRDAILNDVINKVVEVIQIDPFDIKDQQALYGHQFNNVFFMVKDLMEEKNTAYLQAISGIDSIVSSLENKAAKKS